MDIRFHFTKSNRQKRLACRLAAAICYLKIPSTGDVAGSLLSSHAWRAYIMAFNTRLDLKKFQILLEKTCK